MFDQLKTLRLYDLRYTLAAPLLEQTVYPWEALSGIRAFIEATGAALPAEEYDNPRPGVWIHKTAKVAPSAFLGDWVIIGPETEVRHCAFIRGSALVGAGAVVGNSTELKNVILFDRVQVPHYNYVGDSILGYKSHMGAGAVTSNVKQDKSPVAVKIGFRSLETGLKKFGAMLGDQVEVGCNSVLNPGTVVGRGSHVYPLSMMRGFLPSGMIHKNTGETVPLQGWD